MLKQPGKGTPVLQEAEAPTSNLESWLYTLSLGLFCPCFPLRPPLPCPWAAASRRLALSHCALSWAAGSPLWMRAFRHPTHHKSQPAVAWRTLAATVRPGVRAISWSLLGDGGLAPLCCGVRRLPTSVLTGGATRLLLSRVAAHCCRGPAGLGDALCPACCRWYPMCQTSRRRLGAAGLMSGVALLAASAMAKGLMLV